MLQSPLGPKVSPALMQVRYVQAYPEFCRATFDLAPDNFLTICTELQKAYGKVLPLASVASHLPSSRHVQASPIIASVAAFKSSQIV